MDTETNPRTVAYHIILGSDVLEALRIVIKYSTRCSKTIPLKAAGSLAESEIRDALYFAHTQSPLLQEREERQQQILDANYSKVDIDSVVDELEISPGSKRKLKQTLKKFP